MDLVRPGEREGLVVVAHQPCRNAVQEVSHHEVVAAAAASMSGDLHDGVGVADS